MEPLQSLTEHRAVPLFQKAASNVDNAVRIDPHQVAVVREMVNRAKCQAVNNCSDPSDVGVFHNVRGLYEFGFTKRANRAFMAVRAQDVPSEALLMKALTDLSQCVRAYIRRRHDSLPLDVGNRQTDLEQHDLFRRVVSCDKHRLDDHVLARSDPVEIDEWNLLLVRRAKRAVVRLIDGA